MSSAALPVVGSAAGAAGWLRRRGPLPCPTRAATRRPWRRSACVLLVLGALVAGCGHPVDPSIVDPFQQLREKLSQTLTVDWDDVPLETALRELGDRCGLPVE